MSRHTITTQVGATCDGMTIYSCVLHTGERVIGVNVEGFDATTAVGICTACQDLAYPCDRCHQPVCVNEGWDTIDLGWLCQACHDPKWLPPVGTAPRLVECTCIHCASLVPSARHKMLAENDQYRFVPTQAHTQEDNK